MNTKLEQIKNEVVQKLSEIKTLNEIYNYYIEFAGKQSPVAQAMQLLKEVPPEEKKQVGIQLNIFKEELIELYTKRKNELIKAIDNKNTVGTELSLMKKGSLHPITHAIEEIIAIFNELGFTRLSYPEIDYEFYAFEALNITKDHPARDDVETFFLESENDVKLGRLVLTPHTSNGQVRDMKRYHGKPPIRTISIGKTYRPNWDATHTPMFHQFEGICIDENITIANLKGTINYFAKKFFGDDREIRLRPYKFMFTEPSFEIDITCGICGGSGKISGVKCKTCKSGWLELGGSGMIHTKVLENGGIDTSTYSGWAFGFGVERVYAMKNNVKIDDIRILYSGELSFLKKF